MAIERRIVQQFLDDCAAVVGEPVPVAMRFRNRYRGLAGAAEAQWLWLPGCWWVHGLTMRQPLAVCTLFTHKRLLLLETLFPGRILPPRFGAAGILEIVWPRWQRFGDRFLDVWSIQWHIEDTESDDANVR